MIYKSLLKPLLFRLDAERAHQMTISLAQKAANASASASLIRAAYNFQSPLLEQTFRSMQFRNPVSMAAGFDKNGRLLRVAQTLGAGFHEVGSITAQPSSGNPKPRAFRLPADRAVINRMGLNNEGAQIITRRLQAVDHVIPLGINIAKTHDAAITGPQAMEDYRQNYKLAAGVADYIAVNISCPNTASGKTFEDPEALEKLLDILAAPDVPRRPPLLVKFSSDLADTRLQTLLEICETKGVSGYIACNTSTDRSGLKTDQKKLKRMGRGGLSGAPLNSRSLQAVKQIRETVGEQTLIIGVGGIDSFEKALAMLRAGADLLQIYTGLIYEGPALIKRINQELVRYIKRHNITSISEIRKTATG